MSYILDALRRAEADRARGAVPGLHAQNIPADREPAARNFTPLIWAAAAALVLIVAAVAMLVFAPWRPTTSSFAVGSPAQRAPLAPMSMSSELGSTESPSGVAAGSTAQGESPAARPGGLAPAAMPVEPPIPNATRPATPSLPAPAIVAAPPMLSPTVADRAVAGRVATLEPRSQTAPIAQSAPVEHYGAPVSRTSPPTNTIVNLDDLPADVRAQLPKLVVGGSIYSAAPADRMLILNGQVFQEGDRPATDVVLEQIHQKTAVLNFRGQRYQIAF